MDVTKKKMTMLQLFGHRKSLLFKAYKTTPMCMYIAMLIGVGVDDRRSTSGFCVFVGGI
jgi:hypothetical protein